MKKYFLFLLFLFLSTILFAQTPGTLYIIGGGKRPPEMLKEMLQLSQTDQKGYVYVLPMASSVPDSAILWAHEDFLEAGAREVSGFPFRKGELIPKERLDSLRNAAMIYISGGDQNRFMEVVLNSPIHKAIQEAYRNGAMVAGTSAGAAVMSKNMITGNQLKHKEYTGDFPSIEAENIEIAEGLGLIDGVIVDQHFIRRQRMNRLLSVVIEHPECVGIGIDESTAILVQGKKIRVSGKSQVITIQGNTKGGSVKEGKLGARGLKVSVYLPGDVFSLN